MILFGTHNPMDESNSVDFATHLDAEHYLHGYGYFMELDLTTYGIILSSASTESKQLLPVMNIIHS